MYHFWIAHLAIADFVLGILIAIQIFISSNELTTVIGCHIFFTAALPTYSASIFGFLMISYTNYKCIRSSIPIVNLDCIERRRVKLQIGCVWLFWITFHLTGIYCLDSSVPLYGDMKSCSWITAQSNRTYLCVVGVITLVEVSIIGIFQCMIIKDVNDHTETMLKNGIYKVQSCRKLDEKTDKSFEVPFPSDKRSVQISQTKGSEDTPNYESSPSTCIEGQDSYQFEPTTTTRSECPSQIATLCVENDPKQKYKVLSQKEIQYQIWTKKVSKLTKTIAIVFSLFAICIVPHSINLIMLCICHYGFCQDEMLLAITGTLMAFNSFANVIVYTVRNKDFRDEFKKILCLGGRVNIECDRLFPITIML